jgi:diguanylate cyclase (GGDEF)-like protein
MNFYGLPGFIAYSMLLGISYVLIQQEKEERLRYWTVGWGLIFLHAALFMLFPPTFPFDAIARGTLAASAQAFMLAAYFRTSPVVRRAQLFPRVGLTFALNLTFAVASAIYLDLQLGGEVRWPFYLLIGASAVSALWVAAIDRASADWRLRASAPLAIGAYAVQAWLLHAYGVLMASQWLMCWLYLAVAYFFLRPIAKPTVGVVFTAVSFVLWGLVFPVYSLLMMYAADVSNHIESEVWNLPKFLAAASMILALLEERVATATRLAGHDELTGLPNRRLFVDRFEQAVARAARNSSRFAILAIDLNKFKLVNDTLGHQAGDDLLRATSERFRSVLRHTDTLARTGGDEFTVILDGVRTQAEAEMVSNALQRSLDAAIALEDHEYSASASVGVAVYPDDGATLTRLRAVADERMYTHKQGRRAQASEPDFRGGAIAAESRA